MPADLMSGNMAARKTRDLRALCKAASVEQNSERLMELVSELLAALDAPKNLIQRSSSSVEASS